MSDHHHHKSLSTTCYFKNKTIGALFRPETLVNIQKAALRYIVLKCVTCPCLYIDPPLNFPFQRVEKNYSTQITQTFSLGKAMTDHHEWIAIHKSPARVLWERTLNPSKLLPDGTSRHGR